MTQEIIIKQENILVESSVIEVLKKVPEFQIWLAKQNSQATKRNYQIALREFIQIMGLSHFEEFKKIEVPHIIHFRDALIEQGASNRTVNARLSAISSMYKHLIGRANQTGVFINPVKDVPRPAVKQDQYETIVLTPEEVRQIMDQIDTSTLRGLRDRTILGILFNTGCRVGEVPKLKVKHFFKTQGAWHLKFTIKGDKINDVALNAVTIMYINEYLERSGHEPFKSKPLILPLKTSGNNLKTLRHLTSRQISRVWHQYANKAGIEQSHPHTSRATFITEALKNGVPVQNVQVTVGHVFISTTQGYYKPTKRPENSATHAVSF